MHAKGIYEHQRKAREDMRVLNLTRSGYASGQKYAAMLWSGDTCADWKNLKIQIVEGLNMGLSGYRTGNGVCSFFVQSYMNMNELSRML